VAHIVDHVDHRQTVALYQVANPGRGPLRPRTTSLSRPDADRDGHPGRVAAARTPARTSRQ
jgi:hypothetical protein